MKTAALCLSPEVVLPVRLKRVSEGEQAPERDGLLVADLLNPRAEQAVTPPCRPGRE